MSQGPKGESYGHCVERLMGHGTQPSIRCGLVAPLQIEVPLIDGWEVTPSGVSIQQRGGVGEHTVGQSVACSSEENAAKARDLAHEPRLPLHGLVLLEHLQDLMDGEIFIQSEP